MRRKALKLIRHPRRRGIRRNHNSKTRRVVKTITARERRNVLAVEPQAISARIAERKRRQAVFIVAMRDI